jgi:glycine oxidase
VIIGGGAIGCATAFFLTKQGARVTLLERGGLASEASGAAAGMLAALSDEGGDRGPAFQSLCLDSLALYESLLPELEATGVDVRYNRSGVLHLALDDGEASHLRERFEAQRGIAPDSRWLDAKEIAVEEPGANPHAVAALLSPQEHYLDSPRLVEALATAVRSRGGIIETEAPVNGFRRQGAFLRAVQTPSGSHPADAFVIAAGPWSMGLASRLGAYVPVRPMRGQMLSLRGPEPALRHVIWGSRAYLVPREAGQTFAGATVEDVGFRKRTTDEARLKLTRGAVELAPALTKAPLLRAWAGLRPATPDGLPIMGLLPGWSNVWVATGHFRNGILLAPITGELMASSIMAGRPEPQLAPFDPGRFADYRRTYAAAHHFALLRSR